MLARITSHLRAHAVAYVALGFSLSGGGIGAAVAATATSSTAIHACVDRRTGALYVLKRCTRASRTLSLARADQVGGAAGPSVVASGAVRGDNFSQQSAYGLSLSRTVQNAGVWTMTLSAKCSDPSSVNIQLTPIGEGPDGPTVLYAGGQNANGDYQLNTGYFSGSGTLVRADEDFFVTVTCR